MSVAQPTREDFASLLEESFATTEFAEGSVVKGRVLAIEKDHAVIDVGLKVEGRVPLKEFGIRAKDGGLSPGDEVEVYIERVENALGEAVLSREKARREESWVRLEEAFDRGETVQGIIFNQVKGGFTVDLDGAVAFLPGSQVDIRPVRDVAPLMDVPQPFQILKMDRRRGNIVVSRRAVLEETRAEQRSELIDKLSEGQVIEGVVNNAYGTFRAPQEMADELKLISMNAPAEYQTATTITATSRRGSNRPHAEFFINYVHPRLRALQRGDAGLYRFGWAPDYPTLDESLHPLFHSDAVPEAGGHNYGRYAAPDVDALLDRARANLPVVPELLGLDQRLVAFALPARAALLLAVQVPLGLLRDAPIGPARLAHRLAALREHVADGRENSVLCPARGANADRAADEYQQRGFGKHLPRQALAPGAEQQTLVTARFTDGHSEDVTRWTKFSSGDESVASVDDSGLVKMRGRGEAAQQALRLCDAEFVPYDPDAHVHKDVTWTIRVVHDGAIELTSTIEGSDLAPQRFQVTFTDIPDLAKRIGLAWKGGFSRFRQAASLLLRDLGAYPVLRNLVAWATDEGYLTPDTKFGIVAEACTVEASATVVGSPEMKPRPASSSAVTGLTCAIAWIQPLSRSIGTYMFPGALTPFPVTSFTISDMQFHSALHLFLEKKMLLPPTSFASSGITEAFIS